MGGPQGRPARRREAYCRGRLPGPEELLHSLSTRGSAAHARGRAPRGRRGLAVPDRRAAGRGRAGAARTDSGWFTWEAREEGPLLLLAGGSGIAPLMAMIRHRA